MRTLEMRRLRAPIAWLVVLGLALRLFHYGRNPSVWHDEAGNLVNVIKKSFGDLLGPLDLFTTAPPVFLWLQKCILLALGDSTYALRLLSVLASCAGLVLFARLAQKTLAQVGALSAVLLVACSDRLLWHAAEARHYSSDFLIATVLLVLLHGTQTSSAQRRAYMFALLAPVVIFSSFPGVFLCGGVFIALLPVLWRERHWTAATVLGLIITLAFAAFALTTIRAQRKAAIDTYWMEWFPNWEHPFSVPFWAVRSTFDVFDYIGRPIGGILIAWAIVGIIRFWRADRRELVLFAITPMLLAMTAALAKSYPYTGTRTMVFAMPALALMIGSGIDGMVSWRPSRDAIKKFASALAAITLAATFGLALYHTVVPWSRADTAGAAAYVLAHRQPTEPVTANHSEYEYYFRELDGAFVPELRLLDATERPTRLWVVITGHDLRTRDALTASVLKRWRVLERHEFPRASVLVVAPLP